MREAYNDFVGCGYAIQYPLWGKHNDGLVAVFFSTRHSFRASMKNSLQQGVHYEHSYQDIGQC